MSWSLRKRQSTAARLFATDPTRIAKLMTLPAASELKQRLAAAGLDFIGQGDRPTIAFRNFRLKAADTRSLDVLVAATTEVELTVTVDGETPDAIDAAQIVWDTMGEVTSETGALNDIPGAWMHKTASVVHAPGLMERSFSGVRLAQESLRAAEMRVDARGSFRIAIPAHLEIHGFPTVIEVVVEPRLASKEEDEVFYISSPLSSDLHDKLVGKLVGDP